MVLRKYIAHNSLLPIYLAWQVQPNSSNYNLSFSYRFKDHNEISLLVEKLQELIQLKAHLRQTFSIEEGRLVATIHENLPAEINSYSFSQEVFAKLEQVFIRQPHEIGSKSSIRLDIINLNDHDSYIVIFNIHHISMDGHSLDNFILDLNRLMANEEVTCEQAEDYIAKFSKELPLKEHDNHSLLTDYIRQVNDIASKIDYHTANNKHNILNYHDILPTDLMQKLSTLSKQHNLSVFNLLLLAWGVFVSKLLNQKYALINYPVNIRTNKNIDGCFVNLVTLPLNITKDDSYLALISSWHEAIDTFKHVAKVKLSEIINIASIPSFAYSNLAKPYDLICQNKHYEAKSYHQIANSNFGIKYRELDGRLYFSCEVLAEMFPEHLSSSLLSRFFNYLNKLLVSPSTLLSVSDLTFAEEKKRLLQDFNNTDAPYPQDKNLVDLFNEAVAKNPNKIAVKACNGQLTYSELNNKAERLASHLMGKGIKPDNIVGILINNRLEMIVAVMAVLKAGAAYLPLSHDIPSNRLMSIIEDSKAQALLTLPSLVTKLDAKIPIIDLSLDFNPAAAYAKPLTGPNNLAYVIYTSGTTGRPKGVLLEHTTIVNLTLYYIKKFALTAKTNCSKYAGFSFDASVLEIFPALLSGATLHIIPDDDRKDLIAVNNFFNKNKINFAFLPTQFAELFLKLNNTSLTHLIVGGDKLRQFTNQNYEVINAYGPTEASVQSNSFTVDKYYENIPIGSPISNVKCYVVDNNLNLLPIGVVGELMIGGISLARGYLNHPNLTAEKFISNPFQTKKEKSGARNARLYKTGDLVRWLPNGNLEYIGRNDFQIKVRGYRIEPAEIESKLQEIESIEQVLVIALQDSKNDKFLCAYYTAKQEINSVELSTKLSATLASYMIPDCFIWLDKFPINSNGKIDSKLLPKPDFTNHAKEYVAPSNGHEKLICDAFCAVLGLEKVSVHDDFFMLGGSSIKAITLVSNLQANFIINVSDIFNLKTPKHIAKNITFVKNYLRQRLGKIKQIYQIKSSINIDNKQLQDKQTNYLKSLNSLPAHYQKKSISNVLLTGATGYLGCNLLNQLITSTDYKIYLLVRAKSQKEAFNRVNRKFEFYFDKSLESLRGSRVFVFAADIEENDLGLSLKNYQALADKIDSIIHSAALTKHYGEYDKFYSANVQATINLLEFSKLTQLKDFHYISTSSVLDHGYVPDHDQYVFTEDDLGEQLDNQLNVYIKTKHEGEKEVIKYREQGIAGNIYRVGNLAFISSNYRTQENIEDNGFYTRLKCILKLKATAREIGTEEISPVDLTAQAIIKLFDKKQLSNSIQHVFNPNLCNIAEILSQDKTLGLKAIPINEFIDIVIKYLDKPNEHKLIERFLLHQGWLEEHTDSTTIKILQDRTNHILHQLGFDWPQIKQEMFQKYIENNLLKPEKDKTMGLLKKGA